MTASLSELSKLSEQLNNESVRVNEIINRANQSLAGMNLGVEVWLDRQFPSRGEYYTPVPEWAPTVSRPDNIGDTNPETFATRRCYKAFQLGYARTEGGYQLATRAATVEEFTNENDKADSRLVNPGEPQPLIKAARNLRIEALELLPALTDAIKKRMENMIASIEKGTAATTRVIEDTFEKMSLASAVEEMEISVRTYNCLVNSNIRTIGELVQTTEEDLLKTKNFGRKSMNEIKGNLARMGFSLGMKIDEDGNAVTV